MLTPEQKMEMYRILNEMDDARTGGLNKFTSNGEAIVMDEEGHTPKYNSIHAKACSMCHCFFGSESCELENCGKR